MGLVGTVRDEWKNKCGLYKPCGVCEISLHSGALIAAVAFLVDSFHWCVWSLYLFLALGTGTTTLVETENFLLLQFSVSLPYLILSLLLIIGIRKGKKILILIFLIGYIIVQTVAMGLTVYAISTVFQHYGTVRIFGHPFFNLIWAWYPWWVCCAYSVKLRSQPSSKSIDGSS